MRLQRLEFDLVSHNDSFTTLDIISPGFDRFRPPRRMIRRTDFGSAMRSGGMGTPEIARSKSSPPPATRHACVHYKKIKNSKKSEKTGFRRTMGTDGQRWAAAKKLSKRRKWRDLRRNVAVIWI